MYNSIKKISIVSQLLLFNVVCAMEQQIALQSPAYALRYSPWRESYLSKPAHQKSSTCVFCSLPAIKNDAEKYILYRGEHNYAILNLNPCISTGYHCLVIPYCHQKHLSELSEKVRAEMESITQKICHALSDESYEIDINFNIGAQASASIPNHIHQHIVSLNTPRCYTIIEALRNSALPIDLAVQYAQLQPIFSSSTEVQSSIVPHVHHDDTCYYCALMEHNEDQKNFIVHRGQYATILFDHHPFCAGDLIVVPNEHYICRKDMPVEVLAFMHSLVVKVYPLLLDLLQLSDINIGMISYEKKSADKKHIRYQVTPRAAMTYISPVTHFNDISCDIIKLYQQLVKKCEALTY